MICGGLVEIVIVSVKLLPTPENERKRTWNKIPLFAAWKTIFLPSRQYRSCFQLQKHAKLVCCQCLRLRETSLIPGLPQNQTNTFPLPSPFHQVSTSNSNPRINLENQNTFWPTPNTHSPEKEEYRMHLNKLASDLRNRERGFPFWCRKNTAERRRRHECVRTLVLRCFCGNALSYHNFAFTFARNRPQNNMRKVHSKSMHAKANNASEINACSLCGDTTSLLTRLLCVGVIDV